MVGVEVGGVTSDNIRGVCAATGVCGAELTELIPSDDNSGWLMDTVVKATGLTAARVPGCDVVNTVACPRPADVSVGDNTAWANAAAPGVVEVIVDWWLSSSWIGDNTTYTNIRIMLIKITG